MKVGFSRKHRKRKQRLSLSPPGASPGLVVADPAAIPPVIDVIAYNLEEFVEHRVTDLSELSSYLNKFAVTWLNIDGLGDSALVQKIGEMFGLHRLALEDVMNVTQRAKLEQYGDHHFIVTRMLLLKDQFDTEQFSIFIGKNFVVTFQEKPGDCLHPVRERIRSNRGKIRTSGPDYLVYALLDAVIDAYFPVLETFGERVEDLEDEILRHAHPGTISNIHQMKRDLLGLRRAVWPLREVLNSLIRDFNPVFTEETRFYLRDCYDHVVRIMDFVESYRELAADLRDLYLSLAGNRMNEIMKVLTIISTIFIPLTFIVGIYGMNFDTSVSPFNLPETKWYYGYPSVLFAMLTIVVGQFVYFRKKGWIGVMSLPEELQADVSHQGNSLLPNSPSGTVSVENKSK